MIPLDKMGKTSVREFMKLTKSIFFFVFLAFTAGLGAETLGAAPGWARTYPFIHLKDRFVDAEAGDYIVIHQKNNYTLFHIFDTKPNTIVIEEITVPETIIKQYRKKNPSFSWKKWILQPDALRSCWALYELSLQTGRISNYYSFNQQSWMDISRVENFLPTLLNLNFAPVPSERRKKVGAPPLAGERDERRLWQPPLVVDGRTIRRAAFDAWEAKWPKDKSPLSSRTVLIYLLSTPANTPAYFPFWIEIPDAPGEDKIRIIDSGKGMASPMPGFPKR